MRPEKSDYPNGREGGTHQRRERQRRRLRVEQRYLYMQYVYGKLSTSTHHLLVHVKRLPKPCTPFSQALAVSYEKGNRIRLRIRARRAYIYHSIWGANYAHSNERSDIALVAMNTIGMNILTFKATLTVMGCRELLRFVSVSLDVGCDPTLPTQIRVLIKLGVRVR